MSEKNSSLRIDEILLWQGLVNEEQIKTALEYQREHGGRLGSHLVRLGFVTEAQLLGGLARQFDCEAVVLSEVAIEPEAIATVPANFALARTVMPFAFDQSSNTISIACEDPTDDTLIEELKFIAGDKQIKLFVAAEMSLRSAIAEYYLATAATRYTVPEQPDAAESSDSDECVCDEDMIHRGTVLLVTDDLEDDRPLQQALQNEAFRVVCSDSADDAIDLIGSQTFQAVFIRDTVPGNYIDLIDRLRKLSPSTAVRYYESPGRMLLSEGGYQATGDLVIRNMQLFTTLLSTREQTSGNHAGTVGKYVDKLCRRMELPDKDRLSIVSAAYLHDISRFYYGESKSASDCCTRVQMTARLLDSLNYPPLVVGILKSMYIDLEQKYTRRLPIEALGGSIVTIVDVFCEHVSFEKRMSLDKFETARNNLLSLSGRMFLSEVVEAFLELVETEILIEPDKKGRTFNQVLMYCEDMDYLSAISGRLKEENFRPVALDNVDKFVEMYQRSRPDIMILLQEGRASKASSLVNNLTDRGVEVATVPTYLVTSRQAAAELAPMLDLGLEDIFPIENSLDLLVVKLQKLRTRIQESADHRTAEPNEGVTAGNLEDMNLVDLLQAMGPSCRTAKIKITSDGSKLTLCLDKGRIVFAEGDKKVGAEAVYEGVSWNTGKWIVQPLAKDELPEPNNDTSNEALLMEGYRRLDKNSRTPTE